MIYLPIEKNVESNFDHRRENPRTDISTLEKAKSSVLSVCLKSQRTILGGGQYRNAVASGRAQMSDFPEEFVFAS